MPAVNLPGVYRFQPTQGIINEIITDSLRFVMKFLALAGSSDGQVPWPWSRNPTAKFSTVFVFCPNWVVTFFFSKYIMFFFCREMAGHFMYPIRRYARFFHFHDGRKDTFCGKEISGQTPLKATSRRRN